MCLIMVRGWWWLFVCLEIDWKWNPTLMFLLLFFFCCNFFYRYCTIFGARNQWQRYSKISGMGRASTFQKDAKGTCAGVMVVVCV